MSEPWPRSEQSGRWIVCIADASSIGKRNCSRTSTVILEKQGRGAHRACDKIFACDASAQSYQVRVCDELKQMFAAQEGSSEPPNSIETDHVVTPLLFWTGARPPMTSNSSSKMKGPGGIPRLFNEGSSLTKKMTEILLPRLEGGEYLEDNGLNLLIALLNIYCSACAQSVPEQTVSKEIEDKYAN